VKFDGIFEQIESNMPALESCRSLYDMIQKLGEFLFFFKEVDPDVSRTRA